MRLILDEQHLLDKSLNDGYIDIKKPSNTIKILVKHYLSKGMNKQQAFDSIDDFLNKNLNDYNLPNWMKSITGMINRINKSKDFQLVNINKIHITKNEINKIRELNNTRLEKLVFVLLVYAKIYNQLNKNESNWVNEEHKYIFSDAKITSTKEEQGKLIYKLKQLNYVDVSIMVTSTNIKVMFVDNNTDDLAFTITDFRNVVYEYLSYLEPEKYIRCVECGLLIKPSNNKMKYCKDCARKIE
jgi:hypothetical protein